MPQHCVNNNYKLSYQFPPILSAAVRYLAWECVGWNIVTKLGQVCYNISLAAGAQVEDVSIFLIEALV